MGLGQMQQMQQMQQQQKVLHDNDDLVLNYRLPSQHSSIASTPSPDTTILALVS